MVRHASIDGSGGTVWRSQAVGSRSDHGLPTASLDRATHQNTFNRALGRSRVFKSALITGLLGLAGCHTNDGHSWRVNRSLRQRAPIQLVACLYDQKPWLNLDAAADRDPEGIRFRVFLDPGTGRGVLREGTLHVQMYQIDRDGPDISSRRLVSDWHYPTSAVPTIARPGALGEGYFLHLLWARKDTAGHDIEIVTTFEDTNGRKIRSSTKRFRVPKYTS